MKRKEKMIPPPTGLTTVVNYWPDFPNFSSDPTDVERRIYGSDDETPIYKLDRVQEILSAEGQIILSTDKCNFDVPHVLKWDDLDVIGALGALIPDDFHASEWCLSSNRIWLRCDAYVIKNYDAEVSEADPIDLYLKFAVNNLGQILLVVSCHESGK